MRQTIHKTRHLMAKSLAAALFSTFAVYSTSTFAQTALSGTCPDCNLASDPASAGGTQSVAIGEGANSSGLGSTALGADSWAAAGYGIAIGNSSYVNSLAYYGIAIGQGAQVLGSSFGSMAIGADSYVAAGNSRSVAIGFGSQTTRSYEFSVGSSTMTRVVSNVTAGTLATDAVNVSQLQSAVSTAVSTAVTSAVSQAKTYTDQQVATVNTGTTTPTTPSTPTNTTTNAVTYTSNSQSEVQLGNGTSNVTVHNVAAGVEDTDAANVAQVNQALASANSYTNTQVSQLNQTMTQQFSQVNSRIDDLSRRVDGIGAMAAANGSNMFDAGNNHDTQVGVAVSTFRGATGYSVGVFRRISSNAAANVKVSGATHAGGVAVAAGFNMGF
jgi:trimeric autotransporter adhesin